MYSPHFFFISRLFYFFFVRIHIIIQARFHRTVLRIANITCTNANVFVFCRAFGVWKFKARGEQIQSIY